MPPPNFGLFTSLRYDPQLLNSSENTRASGNNLPSPFYNFTYHYERFINALDHFGWRFKTSTGHPDDGSHPEAHLPVSDIEKFRDAASSAVERYFATQAQSDVDRDTQALKVSSTMDNFIY